MFSPNHDFHRALHNARRATRRQDFVAVDQWLKIAERHLRFADRWLIVERRRREVYGHTNAGVDETRR